MQKCRCLRNPFNSYLKLSDFCFPVRPASLFRIALFDLNWFYYLKCSTRPGAVQLEQRIYTKLSASNGNGRAKPTRAASCASCAGGFTLKKLCLKRSSAQFLTDFLFSDLKPRDMNGLPRSLVNFYYYAAQLSVTGCRLVAVG